MLLITKVGGKGQCIWTELTNVQDFIGPAASATRIMSALSAKLQTSHRGNKLRGAFERALVQDAVTELLGI